MKCIFCKCDSSASVSKEHIIPESLGNKSHTLPKGVVCDRCNNYFATKIEKEVLHMPYFQSLRGRHSIESKKGKSPVLPAFITHPTGLGELKATFHNAFVQVQIEDPTLFRDILKGQYNRFYLPYLPEPPKDNVHISRLIGKIAIEASAQRMVNADDWQDHFINNEGLDELRNFVRYGRGYKFWPYYQRVIYSEGAAFSDSVNGEIYQRIHEYDFLFPDEPRVVEDNRIFDNIYFVCAIMGIEYAINLTNAGLGRYHQWLNDNNGKSILLMEKGEFNNISV